MKTITEGADLLGVEAFVESLYRKVPILWQRVFPSWFAVVIPPNRTFLTVESLRPLLRDIGHDARLLSEWAEHPDDWSSVHVFMDPPDRNRVSWNIWVRHAEDREYLAHAFLSTAGAILWHSNSHLRAQWRLGLIGKEIQKERVTDANVDTFFCEAFADRVLEPRRFFCRHSPETDVFGLLEKKISAGALVLTIDPEWLVLAPVGGVEE